MRMTCNDTTLQLKITIMIYVNDDDLTFFSAPNTLNRAIFLSLAIRL